MGINHYSLEKATEFIRKYYHKDIHPEGTLEDDLNSDVTSPHNFGQTYLNRDI